MEGLEESISAERGFPCKVLVTSSEVIVYERPRDPHASVVEKIMEPFIIYGFRHPNPYLAMSGHLKGTYAGHVLEPDFQAGPEPPQLQGPPDPDGPESDEIDLQPTVVVEVGDFETPLLSLHQQAAIYLSPQTSVQLYLAVKVYPRYADGKFPLLVLLYDRHHVPPTTPSLAISCGSRRLPQGRVHPELIRPLLTGVGYGGPPCNRPRLPQYKLKIPTASVYWGTQPPPGRRSIDIDLFALQQGVHP